MGSSRTHRLLVWAAATDRTFKRREIDGRPLLVGKCIHCNRQLGVDLDPDGRQTATLEHIVPKNHGGTDDLDNLAVACERCNTGKGVRLDARRRDDPTLSRVIDTLAERRRERRREPPADWPLPPP